MGGVGGPVQELRERLVLQQLVVGGTRGQCLQEGRERGSGGGESKNDDECVWVQLLVLI